MGGNGHRAALSTYHSLTTYDEYMEIDSKPKASHLSSDISVYWKSGSQALYFGMGIPEAGTSCLYTDQESDLLKMLYIHSQVSN